MRGFCRFVISFFTAVMFVTCMYFMVSMGGANKSILNAYTSVVADKSTSVITKRYSFVATYTYATGDISLALASGYTEDEAEVMKTTGVAGESGDDSSSSTEDGNGAPDLGSYSDQDLRPLAAAVAASSLRDDVMAKVLPDAGDKYYCTGCGSSWSANYGGNSVSLQYRCCTTLVQGVSRFLGNTEFLNTVGNSYLCANWVSVTSGDPHRMNANGMTWGDLKVGDILLRQKHTEIIVYIEGSTIYVGNMGNDSDIVETSQVGYGYTKNASSPLTEFTYVLRY